MNILTLLPNVVVASSIMLSAILGANFLPETCPTIASGLTVFDGSYILQKGPLGNDLSTRKGTTYSRVYLMTENFQDDKIELQNIQTPQELIKNDLDKENKTLSRKIYTRNIIMQILSISLLAFHKVSSDTLVPISLTNLYGQTLYPFH